MRATNSCEQVVDLLRGTVYCQVTGCGAAWQRICFGSRGSQVRILPSRLDNMAPVVLVSFGSCLASNQPERRTTFFMRENLVLAILTGGSVFGCIVLLVVLDWALVTKIPVILLLGLVGGNTTRRLFKEPDRQPYPHVWRRAKTVRHGSDHNQQKTEHHGHSRKN